MSGENLSDGLESFRKRAGDSDGSDQDGKMDLTKREKRILRFNPFTKSFEKVPADWYLQWDASIDEWHFNPGNQLKEREE